MKHLKIIKILFCFLALSYSQFSYGSPTGSSSRSDDPDVQFKTGMKYEQGIEVPQNYDLAIMYYGLAAKLGHAEALNALGTLTLRGMGTVQDTEEAKRLFRQAVAQGSINARYNLALALQRRSTAQDREEANELLEQAAAQGHAAAQYALGLRYNIGMEGRDKNIQEAIRLFSQAADQGHVEAQYALAIILQNIPGREEETVRRIVQAAAQNHAGAQYLLGWYHLYGLSGVSRDKGEAVRLFGLAAAQGHTRARRYLERCMHRHAEAAAAEIEVGIVDEQIDGDAQYKSALALLNTGKTLDTKKVVQLLKLAAARKHAGAQYLLGWLYAHKIVETTPNWEEAARLFGLAAAQDFPGARIGLARVHRYLTRHPQNVEAGELALPTALSEIGIQPNLTQPPHVTEAAAKEEVTEAPAAAQDARETPQPLMLQFGLDMPALNELLFNLERGLLEGKGDQAAAADVPHGSSS